MTRVLLCAGPTLLVIDRDGVLFFRRPGEPDARVPYAPENYPVFLSSARHKYDLSPVFGPHGEAEPALAECAEIPELRLEHLATGETVCRLVDEVPKESGDKQAEPRTAPPKERAARGTHVGS